MSARTRHRSEDDANTSSDSIKRQKKAQCQPEDYTVSWICALHIETAAARARLDCIHDDLPRAAHDINTYTFGSIGPHNIVIASLPAGYYGTNNAATVASNIERSFPSIEIHLMVGIGGGAPGKLDLRLGDIVVGSRVMQYDLGKIVGDGQMERTGIPIIPPPRLLTYITKLRAIHELTPTRVPDILQELYDKYPHMVTYARPNLHDRLFRADFEHDSAAASCDECDESMLVYRLPRTNLLPKIHYEAIASSNQVMKHGVTRDKIAQELQVACFEMEAAGLMNFPYLIIRGICDYSDSHKNKQWQEYAAATAAAYAKEFLNAIPTTKDGTQTTVQSVESKADEEPFKDWWQQFSDSLKFERIDSRHSSIKAAYAATCKWFLQSPEYLAWIDSAKLGQHHGFLWLSGKPGAGKSTIMKFAYMRMKKALRATNAAISFFFNARGDVLERSTTGMYRSLLLQLLQKFPDLQKICEHSDLDIQNGSCPSSETIQLLFQNAISKLGKRSLTCFIDALDECDELQARDMVQYFENLGQQAVDDNVELRICFSSRHYPYIFIRNGIRLTLEDQKGHGEDVEKYIQGNLRADPGPLVKEVQAQILQKAAGVFMWVVLVVDILNKEFARGRMFAVKKRLAEIPDRLSDLFKDILKRDNENMEDLLLCLQWILYAKRPLRREEFYFAVSTGLLGEDDDLFNDLLTSIPDEMMDRFVVSSSKGLAEVTRSVEGNKPTQHTVQFIHESVRDFLIKDNGLQALWPEFGDGFENMSHDKLKQCCYKYFDLGITYLRDQDVLSKRKEEIKEFRAAVSKQAPFLQYATQNVLHHADIAASSMPQDKFLAEFKLEDWILSSNLFENYKVRRYTAKASLFYILADKGFPALIQIQLRHDSNCYTPGERYRYPIFAAIMNRHGAAVQALEGKDALSADKYSWRAEDDRYRPICEIDKDFLWAINNGYKFLVEWFIERGADVNIGDYYGKPALLIALEKGHTSTAELLVEKGADVNTQDLGYDPALLIAVEKGHTSTVKLLVERGADVNFKDRHSLHQTAVFVAVKRNYNTIAAMLIERASDINFENDLGQTLLIHAIEEKNNGIIQLLLEKGADIDVESYHGRKLLIDAIEQQNDNIIQLLLEKGADINRVDDEGQTPLIHAIERKNSPTIQLLLDKGANVNTKGRLNQSPLVLAIEQGNTKDVIQLLIKRGADVNEQDGSGGTPLLYAINEKTDKNVIQLLIEKGASVSPDSDGGTAPLMHAIDQRVDKDVIQLLIEKGADVNAADFGGWAPLIHAIRHKNNEDVVQLLIKKGANVNSKSPSGRTPLIYAIEWGSDEDIIRLLIEKGADINVEDCNGQTALIVAFRTKNYIVTALLIEKGADSSSIGFEGATVEERLAAFTKPSFEHLDPSVPDEDDLSDSDCDEFFV